MLIRSTLLSSILCVLAASAGAQSIKIHDSYAGVSIGMTDPKSVHPKDRSDLRATPTVLLGTYVGSDSDLAVEAEYRRIGVLATDYFSANHLSFSLIAHNLASFNIANHPSKLYFQPSLAYTSTTVDFAPQVPKHTNSGWQPSYTLGLQTKLDTSTFNDSRYSLRTAYTLIPHRNSLPSNQILSLSLLRSFH